MTDYAMLEKLNAISAEIADATDTVLAGMERSHEAMGKLNDLQTGVQHLISLAISSLRVSSETIPLELQKMDIAEIQETHENDDASRHGPQAQDSRETVTPAGGLGGGVGDGTDAGEACSDERAAQSVQAVAETAPVEPGAAPDISASDQVLELWQTGELTANEITEQTFIGSSIVLKILRKARGVGDPRVVRGDLRKAEAVEAKEKAIQQREAAAAAPEAPAAYPANSAPEPATTPAPEPEPEPKAPEPIQEHDRGTVYEIHPTRVKTIFPESTAIGVALAYVSIRDGLVENGGEELRVTGAPLRVIAKLNDQRLYTADDLTEAGRYVSRNVFLRNLNDIQRVLARVGLHIVEYVGGGYQLRRVA